MKIIRFEDCENVTIRYRYAQSPFGKVLVATTDIGLCYIGFCNNTSDLESRFKGALIENADTIPEYDTLHLMGTDFQIRVWEELLKIPTSQTVTYSDIAIAIGQPTAQRAVGTAVGRNPVSVIIPCHRVVGSNGTLGGYYWGTELKKKMLEYEKI